MSQGESRPSVMVVDDDDQVLDLYETWLSDAYDVRTASGGDEALAVVDESVEVLLLDRRMPDLPGDAVLEEVRGRGIDCRVVMLTAVDPDVDIIDMEFDAYVTKPVDREEIISTVETMVARGNYGELLQEYFAVASKRATLETEFTNAELSDNDDYAELVERGEELRTQLDGLLSELTEYGDFEGAFADL
ncbi:HalX domain-containing protein [Halostella salina]|uniref:HalX domain-containing protein n=1 Tax=Halostella salina TaxID=1547897 RepID=UPI000EF8123C|nr:HalX domain-containing protein [Halostella salina]